ncbi:MAG: translocation/assembly module TamB domain-containing protein [Armatimonadetes bacterium]|nr:translocation/assembly module TamB domain-containing protein [Armatimonadota bacterium]
MPLRGIRRARLVMALVALAILAVLGSVAYRTLLALSARAGDLIVQALRQELNREVAIGRVRYWPLGTLVVEDVRIAAEKRLAEGELARVPRLVIRYRWKELLSGAQDPAAAVQQIDLYRPWVHLIRDRNGVWNISRLRRPPRKRPSLFRGVVVVHGGAAQISDYAAQLPRLPAVNRAEGVEARLAFADPKRIAFRASGSASEPGRGRGQASGFRSLEGRLPSWQVQLAAETGDLAYWTRYFLGERDWRIEAGRGRIYATLSSPAAAGQRTRVQFTAQGQDVRLRLPQLGVPAVARTASLVYSPEVIQAQGEGEAAGIPLSLDGSTVILPADQGSWLRFRVRSPAVTLDGLRRAFPQIRLPKELKDAAPVQLDLALEGAPDALTARGEVASAYVQVGQMQLAEARVRWHWQGGLLDVEHAQARALGGETSGQGWIDLRDPERQPLYLVGRATGIQIAQLPGERAVELAGEGAGDFVVTGTVQDPEASLSGRISPLIVNGEHFDELTQQVRYRQGQLEVLSATLAHGQGSATLTGTVARSGELDLHVRTAGLGLAPLLHEFGVANAAGLAYASGRVAGTLARPAFEGRAEVYGLHWNRWNAEYARAAISWEPDQLSLRDLEIRRPPTRLRAGSASFQRGEDGEWHVRVDARVHDVPLAGALLDAGVRAASLRTEPVLGRLTEADLRLEGTLRAPVVSFDGRVDGLAVRGLDVGALALRGAYQGAAGKVSFLAETPQGAQPVLRAEGTLAFPSREQSKGAPWLAVRATLENAPLSPLLRRALPDVDAYVVGDGSLRRLDLSLVVPTQSGSPRVEGTLATGPLQANDQPIGPVHVRFAAQGDALTVPEADFGLGEGVVRLRDGVWLGVPPQGTAARAPAWRRYLAAVAGRIELQDVPLDVVHHLLTGSPAAEDPRQGRFQALLAHLPATLQGTASGVVELRLPEPLSLATPPERWAGIRAAWWRDPSAYARLTGRALAWGATVASADGNVPAPSRTLSGQASLDVEYAGDTVVLNDLTLSQPRQELLLHLTGHYVEGRPGSDDDLFSVQYEVHNLDLATLEDLPFGEVREAARRWRPLAGRASLKGEASGRPRAPHLTLSMEILDATLAGLPIAQVSFPDVQIDPARGELRVAPAQIISKHPDHTHVLNIQGSLPFQWNPPRIPETGERRFTIVLPPQNADLLADIAQAAATQAATARDPSSRWPPAAELLGGLAAIGGRVDARLTLAGTGLHPANSGYLSLESDALRLTPLQTTITGFAARADFEGDEVRLTRFEGHTGRRGSFHGEGTISLAAERDGHAPPRLALALSLADVQLEAGAARATLRSVTSPQDLTPAPVRIEGVWPNPMVRGAILIPEARLPTEFPAPLLVARSPIGNPEFDLRLVIGRDVTIQNPPVLRLGLERGEGRPPVLRVRGPLDTVRVDGRVSVRGQLLLPPLRFNVRGDLEVAYRATPQPTGVPMPAPVRVDLAATTVLRAPSPMSGNVETYEVTVYLRGQPTGPMLTGGDLLEPSQPTGVRSLGSGLTVELTSNPPLPSTELASLVRSQLGLGTQALAGGAGADPLAEHFGRALFSAVVPSLALRLEQAVQQALGLEVFTIEVGLNQPVQLRLGRRLVGNLYGSLTQELSSSAQQPLRRTWEISYRVTPRLRIGYWQEQPLNRSLWFVAGGYSFR